MSTSHPLALGDSLQLSAARRLLLADTRYRLALQQPSLSVGWYDSAEELAELRRIATAGRVAQIRILLFDPLRALRDSHRLLLLAQRLPSIIEIRVPLEPSDRVDGGAYLFNDQGGYLWLRDAELDDGRADRCDRAAQAPLLHDFEQRWDRSARARELDKLSI
ncbi:MAG: hypothetical protein ABW154_04640 [Dyella sp.]